MSLGRQEDRQSDLLLTWRELPRSAGHPFYDQLQDVLRTGGFDQFVEDLCKPYKPEHAVDLDSGAIIAALIHAVDQGDAKTLPATLEAASSNLESVGQAPSDDDPTELVTDKGYHSRDGLKDLEDSRWKTRIAEPKPTGTLRWKGDNDAKRAYYNNSARLPSGVARQAFKLRAELVERGFALILDRGGMRRAWLRSRDNLQKRYLVHISGYNLGLIMRLLTGFGATRRWAVTKIGMIWLRYPIDGHQIVVLCCLVVIGGSYSGAILGTEAALVTC